jgi:NADH:ubiquinone oxidoreductase subunit 5 (subunit L)/multisubunit Na+/H+ antiporter MnhA subunit
MNPSWASGVTMGLAAPPLAFAFLSLLAWTGRSLGERWTVRLVATAFLSSTSAIAIGAFQMLSMDVTEIRLPLGTWFEVGHHEFTVSLVLDRLSVPFAGLGAALTGIVASFSARYLHREPGFGRFFILLTLFGTGVELVALADNLDMIFFGWELVGITSALLIAFFDERAGPVGHGLRAFIIYRASDVGLLAAAVWLHHTASSADLVATSDGLWAGLVTPPGLIETTVVGLLLSWAAMGKGAQVPLGGWLPRAMEGPTPSSAIFYGAISIHLGPYLLLRAAPILDRAPLAAAAVVAVGLLTAGHATFVGRVQPDIKSALAYASMTQVGIIFVEIGLGFRFLAIAHIVGHACIRTLQLLRAPSLLHDYHHLEREVGSHLPRTGRHLERLVPSAIAPWLYRMALERGYFDTLLVDHLVAPFVRAMRSVDAAEERWVAFLEGRRRGKNPVSERPRVVP